jgi:hypothetical protein
MSPIDVFASGTGSDAQLSICSVGFDDHYFSHNGFFGAGAVRCINCHYDFTVLLEFTVTLAL